MRPWSPSHGTRLPTYLPNPSACSVEYYLHEIWWTFPSWSSRWEPCFLFNYWYYHLVLALLCCLLPLADRYSRRLSVVNELGIQPTNGCSCNLHNIIVETLMFVTIHAGPLLLTSLRERKYFIYLSQIVQNRLFVNKKNTKWWKICNFCHNVITKRLWW